MPGDVLQIRPIDVVERGELARAFVESSAIVERASALPERWRDARHEGGEPIEAGNRLREAALLEVGLGAIDDALRILRGDRRGQHSDQGNEPDQMAAPERYG